MPTDLRRFSVSVTPELESLLVSDAKVNHRAVSSQLVWIAEQYYRARRQEAEVFNLGQQTGAAPGSASASEAQSHQGEAVFRSSRGKRPQASAGA